MKSAKRVSSRFSRWTRVWLACLVCLSSACAPKPEARFGSGLALSPSTPEFAAREREMFRLLNRDRQAAGLKPLLYDERLADVARSHSAEMREHKFFDHISPLTGSPDDRLNAAGYLFRTARENLSEAPDVKTSQAGLMLSPHHHENIMALDVSHVGIGIVNGGVHDARNWMFTQLFATPSRKESRAEARRSILGAIAQARSAQGIARIGENKTLNDLAERHIAQLKVDDLDASLEQVGTPIAEAVAQARLPAARAVLLGGQMLTDSGGFSPPPVLLEARATALGLAVVTATQPSGRPVLLVLVIIGVAGD